MLVPAVKSGYDVKVGYKANQIYLLLSSKNIFYGREYFVMDGKKYFLVDFSGQPVTIQSVYTYPGTYPAAHNPVALYIKNTPAIRQAVEEKRLTFKYGGQIQFADRG